MICKTFKSKYKQFLIETMRRHYFMHVTKEEKQGFFQTTMHCTITHLNNLVEQDYRHGKRSFAKYTVFFNLLQKVS